MLMRSYPISFTIHESLTQGENPIAVSVLAIYQSSAEMSVTFLEYRVVMFVSQSNEDHWLIWPWQQQKHPLTF